MEDIKRQVREEVDKIWEEKLKDSFKQQINKTFIETLNGLKKDLDNFNNSINSQIENLDKKFYNKWPKKFNEMSQLGELKNQINNNNELKLKQLGNNYIEDENNINNNKNNDNNFDNFINKNNDNNCNSKDNNFDKNFGENNKMNNKINNDNYNNNNNNFDTNFDENNKINNKINNDNYNSNNNNFNNFNSNNRNNDNNNNFEKKENDNELKKQNINLESLNNPLKIHLILPQNVNPLINIILLCLSNIQYLVQYSLDPQKEK